MSTTIQAEKRTHLKPSALRNLRSSGRLPGVVFGKNADNEMVHISTKQFQKWLKQGAAGYIELEFGKEEPITVLLEDMQKDPVTRDLLHVDFQLVQNDQVIRTKLPVKYKGVPVGTKSGGIVQIQSAFIEVEALPKHLPDAVEFEISGMEVGESLLVSDAKLPSEVTVISGENEFLISIVKP